MIIKQNKLPRTVKSIEDLITLFPECKQFVDFYHDRYVDDLLDGEDGMNILHRLCLDYIKTLDKHYSVIGMEFGIIIVEHCLSYVIVAENQVYVCQNRAHLNKLYTNLIFNHYMVTDPSVRAIEKNNKTYEMAVDIHMKLMTYDISIFEN